MFISDNIPQEFNKIAEISDNYIVLVKENRLNNNTDYEAYIQFYSPSTSVVHLNDYRLKQGNNYTYDYNYTNNGMYSYVDNVELSYSLDTYTLDSRETSLYDRFDYWSIIAVVAILLYITIIVVNLATSLVHRGGIFHA